MDQLPQLTQLLRRKRHDDTHLNQRKGAVNTVASPPPQTSSGNSSITCVILKAASTRISTIYSTACFGAPHVTGYLHFGLVRCRRVIFAANSLKNKQMTSHDIRVTWAVSRMEFTGLKKSVKKHKKHKKQSHDHGDSGKRTVTGGAIQ